MIKTRDCECHMSPSRKGSDGLKLAISSRLRLESRSINFLIASLVMFQRAFMKLKLFLFDMRCSPSAKRHPGYAWVGQSSQEPVLWSWGTSILAVLSMSIISNSVLVSLLPASLHKIHPTPFSCMATSMLTCSSASQHMCTQYHDF